jgi:hypothetical protein
MSVGNLKNQGNKGNNFPFQLAVLKLLDQINSSITALPGVDYETRTTMYQATAAGPGYSIGDIIVRYDIISVPTGTVSATVWFNQTTQAVIAAPAPGNITPVAAPSSVTVINGPLGAAVNIQDGGNSITVDALALDVALSTRATEATLATRASEATLATMLTLAGFQARINTLGQKTMANSTPVVLPSDQSAIPVTLPAAVSRVPSVVNVPASSAGSTTAGVQELSILVIGGGNTVGGVSIPSGTVLNYVARGNDTVGALAYTTGAGGNRLILTYLT